MHLWALTIAAFGNCCPEIFLNIAEKIEQDSLDSIPTKFNSLAGKFTRGNKAKHCWSTNF